MVLQFLIPVALLFYLVERSRLDDEIRKCQEEIDDLRGWKNPAAARRVCSMVRRLSRHQCRDMDLTRCHLRGMALADQFMVRARLVGADLLGTNLSGSDLSGADLQGADLRMAILRRAGLQNTLLWGADLREASLAGARLDGALLKDANLAGADLTDADFSGASLLDVQGLAAEQLAGARSLHQAKLPPDLLRQIKAQHPQLLKKR
jgi:uncharacterized protein YjbI with pentapeptide repeats